MWVSVAGVTTQEVAQEVGVVVVLTPGCYTVIVNWEAWIGCIPADCNSVEPEKRVIQSIILNGRNIKKHLCLPTPKAFTSK